MEMRITAKQARLLIENEAIKNSISKICDMIETRAISGESTVSFYFNKTSLITNIINVLENNGYICATEFVDPINNYGNECVLKISW